MKKILTRILVVFVSIVVLVAIAGIYKFNFTDGGDIINPPLAKDVKNISYTVDGKVFTLTNGVVTQQVVEGSASTETLRMFGEPVYADLSGDGIKDAAVLLSYDGGGSGTFYYAVLAIATSTTFTATNALFLGDRIAPQTINIVDGRAVFNYAERKAGEPMTTQPSVGKSLFIQYDKKTGTIGEFVKDFEGEANPSTMTLGMKKWAWVKTQLNDGTITTPKQADKFTLTFKKDNQVAVTTDCNGMGGRYTAKANTLHFDQMMSTMMYCEGSQEQEFAKHLQDVQSYLFTSKGELILEIKMDSGVMIFK